MSGNDGLVARAQIRFPEVIQRNDLTGKSPESPSSLLSQKYSDFQKRQISLYRFHPVPPGGALANVINVGAGCDGREGAGDGRCRSGRASRVVLISLKLVSSLRSFPQATVAQSSPGRSRSKPYKHRAGMPGVRCDRGAHYAQNLLLRAHRRPVSPRPLIAEDANVRAKPRASGAARSRSCLCLHSKAKSLIRRPRERGDPYAAADL